MSKTSKYLSFDALKGLKDVMVKTDTYTTKEKYPSLSDEMESDIDVLLYKSYLRKESIRIVYYDNKGEFTSIEDCILDIDVIHHCLKLLVHKKIYLSQIISLSEIER